MKTTRLRVIVASAVLVVMALGFFVNTGIGTLSGFGWSDIALLCPLGALESLVASKTMVPRVVIALVAAVVLILLFGRAFCGWICPVPLVKRLRNVFSTPEQRRAKELAAEEGTEVETETLANEKSEVKCGAPALSKKELKAISRCSHAEDGQGCGTCGVCQRGKGEVDSRHFVLGGALLSAAVFGFPVFCLICPIGLTFATILLVVLLFGGGDVTWTVVVAPALLLIEVVFFRKWCSRICPLSALMSLIAKGNRTFTPTIDDSLCLETTKEVECQKCAKVCEVGINPRRPDMGTSFSECLKCRECVDCCPTKALSLSALPKKKGRRGC